MTLTTDSSDGSTNVARSRARRTLIAFVFAVAVVAGPTATAALAKPVNNLPPEIEGRPLIGETLGCGAGSWVGNSLSFTFRWERAGIVVGNRVSYRLTTADEHKPLWCVVTATQGGESTEIISSNSYEIGGPGKEPPKQAPTNTALPLVSGEGKVGATLSCSQGGWANGPTEFEYKWLRARSGESETIKGAASSTYVAAGEDQGDEVSCKVTARNSAGSSAPAASSNRIMIKGEPPKSLKSPEVVGTPEVGKTLTCFNPESNWSGSRPLTFSYGWVRVGVGIVASGATYTVQSADEGHSLQCEVTAKNSEGPAVAKSSPVAVVPPVPESIKPPTISPNSPQPGATLFCSQGTWTASAQRFEYEWHRGSEHLSATKNELKLPAGEAGYSVYCTVTAFNSSNRSASRSSEPVVVAEEGGSPPTAPQERPVVEGTLEFGHVLTCAITWEEQTEVSYQWVRDKGLSSEVSLELGTSSTYVVVHEDEGHTLSCKTTARNRFGKTGPLESSPPQHVKGGQPVFIGTTLEVAGNARVGETLTCPQGQWSGAPRPTFAYEWKRNGAKIATGSAYKIVTEDRGTALTCFITATNSEGTGTAESVALHVPGSPPEGETPTIEGEAVVGATLTCDRGTWTGAPTPTTFTYQWLLNGVVDSGEVASTFTVGPGDRGLLISCSVTGSSSEGSSTATSSSLHVPGTRPQEVVAPQISGSAALGATLTCNRGIWKGAPPPTFSYQWLRDGVAIASATASTYVIEAADQGHLLSCDVVAANSEGRVEVESTNALAVPAHLSTSGAVAGFKGTGSAIFVPSAAVILADLARELTNAQRGLRLHNVLKHGGFAFSFVAPTAGTLELSWYLPAKSSAKSGHTSSTKVIPLLVGRTSMVFSAAVKHTVHLKLTSAGRRALKSKKRVKLLVKALFSVAHGKPVAWTGTLVLSH